MSAEPDEVEGPRHRGVRRNAPWDPATDEGVVKQGALET